MDQIRISCLAVRRRFVTKPPISWTLFFSRWLIYCEMLTIYFGEKYFSMEASFVTCVAVLRVVFKGVSEIAKNF